MKGFVSMHNFYKHLYMKHFSFPFSP